jgi:hypothetical protein
LARPSPNRTSHTEGEEWDPSRLVDNGYPTPSPSVSSGTSFRAEKNLPPPPSKLHEETAESSKSAEKPQGHPSEQELILVGETRDHPNDDTYPDIKIDYEPSTHSASETLGASKCRHILNAYRCEDILPSAIPSLSPAPAHLATSLLLSHDAHGALHRMKGGINDLPVEIPGLMNVLDEIAKVHLAISGKLVHPVSLLPST